MKVRVPPNGFAPAPPYEYSWFVEDTGIPLSEQRARLPRMTASETVETWEEPWRRGFHIRIVRPW